ncbi:MAG: hypothetical protein ACR2KQ_02665 [Actinomycetota bacterium]
MIALASAVFFGLLYMQDQREEAQRQEVQAVAREFVTRLTNFSHETIEEDAAAIREFATGEFEGEVDAFFGEQAIEAIETAEAASSGRIESLFVQELDDDRASVFVVVEETITNAGLGGPQTDILRLEAGLLKVEDGWKVERVDIFQSPSAVPALG